jgi:hypothetical protein
MYKERPNICPGNHVGRAWRLLTAKYERKGTNDLPYLMRELHECKWHSCDVDPSLWLADMRAIDWRIVATGGQDKSENEWLALIRSNTELPEFQQLYFMLDAAQQVRLADWEREIVNLWNNRRDPRTVPTTSGYVQRHAPVLLNVALRRRQEQHQNPFVRRWRLTTPFQRSCPMKCFRCGKLNHHATECQAKYHANGTRQQWSRRSTSRRQCLPAPASSLLFVQSVWPFFRECPNRQTQAQDQTQSVPEPPQMLSNPEADAAELYFLGNVELKEGAKAYMRPCVDEEPCIYPEIKVEWDESFFTSEPPTPYERYLNDLHPDKPEVREILKEKNGKYYRDFPGFVLPGNPMYAFPTP